MEFDQFNQFSEENFENSIGFREVLENYLIHWKWYILSILLFGILGYLYITKVVPVYNSFTTILIKEQERNTSLIDFSTFEDLGLMGSSSYSLENEIHLLTSRRLMKEVIKELKLNIQYFTEDNPYNKELYSNTPIILNFIPENDSLNYLDYSLDNNPVYKLSHSFKINILSYKQFEMLDLEGNSLGKNKFGQEFKTNFGNISISFNGKEIKDFEGKNILVKIIPLESLVNSNVSKLVVETIDERSRVLKLSIKETVGEKGIAILNNLVEQYNFDIKDDKNKIFLKTTQFLNDRLLLLTSELTAIEGTAEKFRTKNRMIDGNEGQVFLQSSTLNESDLISANTQLELIEYMFNELNQKRIDELLPANIGLEDNSIVNIIENYNELILRRNRILKSSSTINPIIIDIDSQLEVLINNLKISLNSLRSSTLIQFNALSKQSGKIGSRIASVPKNEREFNDIVRQLETKNALYLFLLQKREETIISEPVNVDRAKVIDKAYSSSKPVSPNKKIIYFGLLLLGLLIPTGFIYLKEILDYKIHDENDIKRLNIPYLGDVPLSSSKAKLFLKDGDNSNIAEAFRYIRTNINFMLDRKDKGKTVFVTSTKGKEGKTFTAINLALSLAISGKNTLLIAMDLRNPKIIKYLKLDDMLGITNYIKNDELSIDDVINKYTNHDNLDIINSGDIPPNPVELLMSKRLHEIFDYAKDNYEYIIVDTAPVGMVTDTVQISNFADLTIYVIKANFLDKRMLYIPNKLYRENKLPNMAILINGSDHRKGAYSYGYSYGYGNNEKKSWYKIF